MWHLDKTFACFRHFSQRARNAFFCFFLISLSFLATPATQAAEYFFVGSNFPILSEQLPDKSYSGIGVDIIQIICKRLHHTAKIQFYPWNRAQALVKAGKADVLIAPYKTPQREQWMNYSAVHFFEDASVFFQRPGNTIVWDGNFETLRDRRIGIVPGWSVGADFERLKPHLHIDYAPTLDLCLKKLLAGRIELVPTQVREARAAFQRLGLLQKDSPVMLPHTIETHYNYYGFSKLKQKELQRFKSAFDAQLLQLYQSGEIQRILSERYNFPHNLH